MVTFFLTLGIVLKWYKTRLATIDEAVNRIRKDLSNHLPTQYGE